MTLRSSILLALALLTLGYAFGRYTAPKRTEVKTEIQTQEVEHTNTVTQTRWLPSGEVIQETHAVMDEAFHQAVKSDQVVQYKADSVTVSALASMNITGNGFAYGLSISKPLIGPIAVGAGAFTDGRVFMSVGINL